ncbi:BT1926 family outer membrane beta-barrel protein [Pontibacter ruber]|uniref:BT1926 family outer membrane beta-barrel protein n=1 Tax=Pontibacter ruber TaxID=1343895 RepID=A0ABW5CWS4_9BACT|nr:BT1926 family outer membrane beta-barrel protein [Pontibacter ruber]
MKNTLLTVALAFIATFSAQAQDTLSTSTVSLKPVAGDRTAEVGFNFSYGTFLKGGQLAFRKFTTDTKAVRLGLSANFNNDHPADKVTAVYGTIGVTPGIERHFAGTKRLSPYMGAELPLSYTYSKYEDETKSIKGAFGEGGSNRANVGVGLNAIAGIDLYLLKNFYVGFEFGAGISYRNYQDVKVDFKEDFLEDRTIEGRNSINFNTFTNGGLRLGFVF